MRRRSAKEREAWARLEEILLRLDKALEEKPIDWSKIKRVPFEELTTTRMGETAPQEEKA